MDLFEHLAATTRTVADRTGPAVVRIGRGGGRGSGIVVDRNRVLTNAHNLRGGATTVTFADGSSAVGRVTGADLDGDLAVIDVDTGAAEPVVWGEPPGVGEVVFAVARAASGTVRTTWGAVTATERAFRGPRGRRIGGSLEHTAPMAPRSSGGPLVDTQGRLVGLNTNRVGDGFYLAIPADADLHRRVDLLAEGSAPPQRHLGVALAPAHVARRLRRSVGLPERDGLLVRGVDPDQPAGRAGVREGDLIVRAGEHDIAHVDDLYLALDHAGDALELVVVRGAEETTLTVRFLADAEGTGEAGTGEAGTGEAGTGEDDDTAAG